MYLHPQALPVMLSEGKPLGAAVHPAAPFHPLVALNVCRRTDISAPAAHSPTPVCRNMPTGGKRLQPGGITVRAHTDRYTA